MHWRAHWWGTEIVSDNKEDEKFLKELQKRLPKKPLVTYEGGELDSAYDPDSCDNLSGGFTLIFDR